MHDLICFFTKLITVFITYKNMNVLRWNYHADTNTDLCTYNIYKFMQFMTHVEYYLACNTQLKAF